MSTPRPVRIRLSDVLHASISLPWKFTPELDIADGVPCRLTGITIYYVLDLYHAGLELH